MDFDPTTAVVLDLETPFDSDPNPVKLETSCISRQPQTLRHTPQELWKSASVFKKTVALKLREAGMQEDADKLDDCHEHRTFAQCAGCSSVKVYRNRCDNFFCPECQPSLSKRRREGVEWWVQKIKQPKHVVLTVRNIPDLTKGHILELKKWFTRLRHRKFCSNWEGGLYSIEITNEGAGWHLHLHALVNARFIDNRSLATEWGAVNGGLGYIVKVKDCRDRDYLKEVTKYAVKGSNLAGWSPSEIKTFIEAFRGVKCFGVFGSLYGKRTEFADWLAALGTERSKCECGSSKCSYYSESEWLERSLIPNQVEKSQRHRDRGQLDFLGRTHADSQIFSFGAQPS